MTHIVEQDPLFNRDRLYQAIRNIPSMLSSFLEKIPESEFESLSDDEISQRAHEEFFIRKLEIDEEEKFVDTIERNVEPDYDAIYMSDFHGGGRRSVAGTRSTISIPFRGDKNLWHFAANTATSVLPIGRINATDDYSGFLIITIDRPHNSSEERALQVYDSNIRAVRDYIGYQAPEIDAANQQLSSQIEQAIATRRERLVKKNRVSSLFGGKPTPPAVSTRSAVGTKKTTTATARGKQQYDVFISHAFEDKDDFVRSLADALIVAGLQVWYDEHSLRMGDSLRKEIDKGLRESRFGIVVLSPNFFAKDWPQRELDGLLASEINGRKVILPIWHKIDKAGVEKESPTLAGRVAAKSADGVNRVVAEILKAIG